MKRIKLIALIFIFVIQSFSICYAVDNVQDDNEESTNEDNVCYGYTEMTPEEYETYIENIPLITYVKPNRFFVERLQPEKATLFSETMDIAEIGSEIITDEHSAQLFYETTISDFPEFIDNSVYFPECFPSIGNQGNLGSCVGWALGYYQMSYNYNFLRNSVSGVVGREKTVFSPNWIYNLGNEGTNKGMNFIEGINILSCYGCPTINSCPIINDKSSYDKDAQKSFTNWFAEDDGKCWEEALKYKCRAYRYDFVERNPNLNTDTPIETPDSEALTYIKTLLGCGYILSIHTYLPKDTPNSPCVKKGHGTTCGIDGIPKEEKCIIQTSCDIDNDDILDARHAMTVVGYDDNFYADINGNNEAEPGEFGAFKLVNSHGEKSFNGGFVWIMYDALNSTSSIEGFGGVVNRVKAFLDDEIFFVKPIIDYQPLLTAKIGINTKDRRNLIVKVRISEYENPDESKEIYLTDGKYINREYNSEANKYFDTTIAFNKAGGVDKSVDNYALNDTFVFDITPILYKLDIVKGKKYTVSFLLLNGNIRTTIKSLSITEHGTNIVFDETSRLNIISDEATDVMGVTFLSSITTISEVPQITANLNAELKNGQDLSGKVVLIDAKDNEQITTAQIIDGNKKIQINTKDKLKKGINYIKILPGLRTVGGNVSNTIYYPIYVKY